MTYYGCDHKKSYQVLNLVLLIRLFFNYIGISKEFTLLDMPNG